MAGKRGRYTAFAAHGKTNGQAARGCDLRHAVNE
jgi:hypothetical protein